MDYRIDLDPTHRVLRVTVGRVLTDELAREVRQTMVRLASRGGPYAVITDLSEVEDDRLTPKSPQNWRQQVPPSQTEDSGC